MLTVVECVVGRSLMIVQLDQLSLNTILEVFLLSERVSTENDLFVFGHVSSFKELITNCKFDLLWLQMIIVLQKSSLKHLPELLLFEGLEIALGNPFGVFIVSLIHFLMFELSIHSERCMLGKHRIGELFCQAVQLSLLLARNLVWLRH